MKSLIVCVVFFAFSMVAAAQTGSVPQGVALSQTAVAVNGSGVPSLEATLKTTTLNGAADSPVTNIKMVVRNTSNVSYAYLTGLVTFYDGAGVRCGEGFFKADSVAEGEAFETDTPGIRIRCVPATWRIIATNLVPRLSPSGSPPADETSPGAASNRSVMNLVISVDGEEHPIQLEKPMVITLAGSNRTILVRLAP